MRRKREGEEGHLQWGSDIPAHSKKEERKEEEEVGLKALCPPHPAKMKRVGEGERRGGRMNEFELPFSGQQQS